MAVTYDETTYNQMYRIRVRVDLRAMGYADAPAMGEVVGYGKWAAMLMELPEDRTKLGVPQMYVKRAKWLISRLEGLGLNASHRVLIVGSGFGWLIHAFRHAANASFGAALQNYPNVWGIEESSYIQANWASNQLQIAGADDGNTTVFLPFANTPQVRNALRSLTGAKTFDVIITEQVIEGLTNAELVTFAANCEAALNSVNYRRILHLVQPNLRDDLQLGFQSRSLDQWYALRPTHSFVSVIDGDYRLGAV